MKLVSSLRTAVALVGTFLVTSAHAEPADYVAVPQVVSGEREIDLKAGSAQQGAADRFGAASIGFGYGINDVWATEFYLKYEKLGNAPVHYDAVEWENKFQLTEPGQYAVDLGLLTEVEVPRDRTQGYELKTGLLSQSEFGRLQLNGNLLLFRSVRAEGFQETDLGYQWQAKYRWRPAFEYGFQGFGELGKWNDWADRQAQTHRAGPAIFGMWGLGGRQRIKYNAAWLVGLTGAAPDHTARLQVEYEF